MPDNEANAEAFARPINQYRPGPFPQIRLLLLSECGSHAVVDSSVQAKLTPAQAVLPSLGPGMLLLHDAQFTRLRFWQAIRDRRAHVMGLVPSHHLTSYLRQLSDSSYLAVYQPSPTKSRYKRASNRYWFGSSNIASPIPVWGRRRRSIV